jgi:hypothetical protein
MEIRNINLACHIAVPLFDKFSLRFLDFLALVAQWKASQSLIRGFIKETLQFQILNITKRPEGSEIAASRASKEIDG